MNSTAPTVTASRRGVTLHHLSNTLDGNSQPVIICLEHLKSTLVPGSLHRFFLQLSNLTRRMSQHPSYLGLNIRRLLKNVGSGKRQRSCGTRSQGLHIIELGKSVSTAGTPSGHREQIMFATMSSISLSSTIARGGL